MPSYNLKTAAFAAGTTNKWIDNLASHHKIRGVISKKRGISREFTFDGVVLISLIHALCSDLRISVQRAKEIAEAMAGPGVGLNVSQSLKFPCGVVLGFDTETAVQNVRQRLLAAVESVPRARRGRPRALQTRT